MTEQKKKNVLVALRRPALFPSLRRQQRLSSGHDGCQWAMGRTSRTGVLATLATSTATRPGRSYYQLPLLGGSKCHPCLRDIYYSLRPKNIRTSIIITFVAGVWQIDGSRSHRYLMYSRNGSRELTANKLITNKATHADWSLPTSGERVASRPFLLSFSTSLDLARS